LVARRSRPYTYIAMVLTVAYFHSNHHARYLGSQSHEITIRPPLFVTYGTDWIQFPHAFRKQCLPPVIRFLIFILQIPEVIIVGSGCCKCCFLTLEATATSISEPTPQPLCKMHAVLQSGEKTSRNFM